MTKEAQKQGKVTTISVVLTLLASLGGNGYFGVQNKAAQEELIEQRAKAAVSQAAVGDMQATVDTLTTDVATLRVELTAAKSGLVTRHTELQSLVKRFEDHLTAFVSTRAQTDVGLQGIRTELGALKTTLITIVTKLR